MKNKLELQVGYLSNNNDIKLLFSQGYLKKDDSNLKFDTVVKKYWDCNDIPVFTESNQIPILSVLVKRKALKDVGYFNKELEIQNVEDYHLWFKLMLGGFKFASIEYRLFYYSTHENK